MRLGRHTNGSTDELEMQAEMCKWLEEMKFMYLDEFHVSEVGRRADFAVFKPGNGLINIEAKSMGSQMLIDQLMDHAKYCDYCFAYIIDYGITPKWFKEALVRGGFGLIIYNHKKKVITEVLEAHRNKGIDNNLRKIIYARFEKKYKNKHREKNTPEVQKEIDW